MSPPVAIYDRFSLLAPRYDVVLCDVWGVVHNGVRAYAEACEALARFRSGGGTVILITNAPRPSGWVIRQLDRFEISRDAYDGVTSSGDVTRDVMSGRGSRAVFHVGPERDISIFDGLDVRFSPVESAEYTVCTGLFDDTNETPEDYRRLLETMHGRRMLMLCANPDLVVERGDKLVYCAGSLAAVYAEKGGEVIYAGKPHMPIYARTFAAIDRIKGSHVPGERILVIGDGVDTDLLGAHTAGLRSVFIASAVHLPGGLDARALAQLFASRPFRPFRPIAALPALVW